MKRTKRCIKLLFFITMTIVGVSTTKIEAKAYTNADVTDPVVRRMGKQLGWADSFIKKTGGYITYQITGINDQRIVYTSFDGYPYGETMNQNRIAKRLSTMICKQHQNRTDGSGKLLNKAYVLSYSNAPTCTTGGWIWLGCNDDIYSFKHYYNFKEQLVPDEAHRTDLSSHYGYYQEALGHDYNYDTWVYANNNGISNGMRYHKCNYCKAYTDLEYGCWVKAGDGIASVTGQNWYKAGSTVTLTAMPKAGYTWNKWIWTGNGSSTKQTYIFTINKAYEFTAIAFANQYSIHFDANGGEGYMDDIVLIYDIPHSLPTNRFTRNNGYGDSVFLGWNTRPDAKEALYHDGEQVVNLTEIDGFKVTLYAIWDDCPWIEVYDMYYSLKDAQNGVITYEELLSHATVWDREDGDNILSGIEEEKETSFTIIDYHPTDFTIFTSDGSVTETFQVIDSIGNSYKQTITVHIVDTEPREIKPIGTTRFINERYYYESYENGGLEENSIWKIDSDYVSVIKQAFENSKNNTPMYTLKQNNKKS